MQPTPPRINRPVYTDRSQVPLMSIDWIVYLAVNYGSLDVRTVLKRHQEDVDRNIPPPPMEMRIDDVLLQHHPTLLAYLNEQEHLGVSVTVNQLIDDEDFLTWWHNSLEEAGSRNWLHTQQDVSADCWTPQAMDAAVEHGRVMVLQWLHDHRSEGCTAKAMDDAASNGHLEAVKWLHTNRHKSSTTHAMEMAAANGHLDVVIWLHEHRTEGMSSHGIDNCHSLDVVRWLHLHRSESWTSAAIESAVERGDRAMLDFLLEPGQECRAPLEVFSSNHSGLKHWFDSSVKSIQE